MHTFSFASRGPRRLAPLVCLLAAILVAGCEETGRGSRQQVERAAAEPATQPGDATVNVDAAGRADAAVDMLMRELMSRLRSALDEGGPAKAVRVCGDVAQDVTKAVAENGGVHIRRTSLRTRNPDNAPDAFEREWLEAAAEAMREGNAVSPTYQVVDLEDGGRELRHLRPIVFPGGMCSQCHGSEDEIAPEVRALLAERYPEDRVIGFRPGDLRGAFSVRVPLR